ncbi:hypothetical protein [Saccharomonospora sp.]|uniref:LppU/SCO3897 family protein n=1 Tax=Saccharomonospora sp. TaxID=33913 RepID=UPI00262F83C0|nr:hypothetical protein [Saccharomonospora sp.]
MPPVPSTPPEKKKVGKRIAVIVAVVGAFVFAGLLAVGYLNAAHNAEPGDCLHIEDFSDQKEAPKVHECSDEEATLKVAVKLEDNSESCPDGDYDQMVYEDGARFCLMLNVEEGECLANVRSPSKGYEKVACTDPKADVSVVKIVEGTDDIEQACAPVAGAMAAVRYSEPATVICVGEPTAV